MQLRDAAIPPSLCPSRRVTRQPAAASHPVSRCCHCTWDIKRVRTLACLLGICMLDLHIRPNVHVRVSAPTLTRHGGRHELAVKVMTAKLARARVRSPRLQIAAAHGGQHVSTSAASVSAARASWRRGRMRPRLHHAACATTSATAGGGRTLTRRLVKSRVTLKLRPS